MRSLSLLPYDQNVGALLRLAAHPQPYAYGPSTLADDAQVVVTRLDIGGAETTTLIA